MIPVLSTGRALTKCVVRILRTTFDDEKRNAGFADWRGGVVYNEFTTRGNPISREEAIIIIVLRNESPKTPPMSDEQHTRGGTPVAPPLPLPVPPKGAF